MRDNRAAKANLAEQVQPFRPRWIGANLVDLVYGKGVGAEADRRGAGEGDASAFPDLRGEPFPHGDVSPVPQGVGWAARSGEDVIRIAKTGEELLELERRGPAAMPEGGEPDLASHVFAEIADGSDRDLVRVLLEAEGRIKENGVEAGVANPPDQLLVDRCHHRAGLSGPENGDQACRARVTRAHTKMLRRSNPTVPA